MGIIAQMADGLTDEFPDVFLGVEVGGAGGEVEHVEAGMVMDELLSSAFVPGSAVPQQQDGAVGEAGQDMLKEMDGGVTVEVRGGQGDLLAVDNIERAVEMHAIALRAAAHGGGVPNRRPDAGQAGLQVGAHLVDGQNDAIGVSLPEVGHFFSSSASKSASAAWLGRDLYTPSTRW